MYQCYAIKISVSLRLLTLHQQTHIFVFYVLVVKNIVIFLKHLHFLFEFTLVESVLLYLITIPVHLLLKIDLHLVKVVFNLVKFAGVVSAELLELICCILPQSLLDLQLLKKADLILPLFCILSTFFFVLVGQIHNIVSQSDDQFSLSLDLCLQFWVSSLILCYLLGIILQFDQKDNILLFQALVLLLVVINFFEQIFGIIVTLPFTVRLISLTVLPFGPLNLIISCLQLTLLSKNLSFELRNVVSWFLNILFLKTFELSYFAL